MQNFSDYIKNNNSASYNSDNKSNDINTIKTNEALQNKIDEYSRYSSDKLLSEFMKLTIEKKRKGELSDNELEKLKNTITPMLNNEQKKSLEELINMVKNVK